MHNRHDGDDVPAKPKPDIPIRDPRVYYAAERTLLAWLRTGIALVGLGFVVARFGLVVRELALVRSHTPVPPRDDASLLVGSGLILLGVAVNILASVEHVGYVRQIRLGGDFVPPRRPLGIVVSGLMAILGVVLAAYLLYAAY